MKRIVFAVMLAMCLHGCRQDTDKTLAEYRGCLAQSDALVAVQEWDQAADMAIKTLEISKLLSNSEGYEAEALCRLAAIDIATWRDDQAWRHACEAEEKARTSCIDSLIAYALLLKGKECLCTAITEKDSRDDEALAYLQEALSLSGTSPRLRADILYNMSQVYVGKNRFREKIDLDLYELAGQYLDAGLAVAEENGLEDMVTKALTYQMRWFRQGGKYQEGIECCLDLISSCTEDNYLAKSQAWNNLTMLYALADDLENCAAAHQQYVYAVESYMKQKADLSLQEMESRYEAGVQRARAEKLRTMLATIMVILLLIAGLALNFFLSQRRLRSLNAKLSASDRAKEQLLHFVSRDLTSPSLNRRLKETMKDIQDMTEEEILRHCSELFSSEGIENSSEIGEYIAGLVQERRRASDSLGLTRRELEIIRLSRDGLSAADIAGKLSISVHTVNNHKQNIYSKMGVGSNSEMLLKAEETGLI